MRLNRKDSDQDPTSPRQNSNYPVSPRQVYLEHDEQLDKSGAEESYYDDGSNASSTGKKTIKKELSQHSQENQESSINTAQKFLPHEEIEISRQTNELDLGKNRSTKLLQVENDMSDQRKKQMSQTDGMIGRNRFSKFPDQATEMVSVSQKIGDQRQQLSAIDDDDGDLQDEEISIQKEQQFSKKQMIDDLNGQQVNPNLSNIKKLTEEDKKILMKSINHMKSKAEINQKLESKKLGKVDGLPKKVDDFVLDEDVEPISYQKVVTHINQMHPQKPPPIGEKVEAKNLGESFGLSDPVGSLLFSTYFKCLKKRCNCFMGEEEKKEDEADGIVDNDITPMAKEIGLGSTLFLMNVNALMYFFVFLTIVNIPLMVVFANGTSMSTNSGINSAFVTLSLGNLGGRTESCSQINLRSLYGSKALNKNLGEAANLKNYGLRNNLTLSCSQGNHLSNLKFISLYDGKDQLCQNLNQFGPGDMYKVIDKDCIYNSTHNTLFEKITTPTYANTLSFSTFVDTYKHFLNNGNGSLSIPFLTGTIVTGCYTKQAFTDKPVIIFAQATNKQPFTTFYEFSGCQNPKVPAISSCTLQDNTNNNRSQGVFIDKGQIAFKDQSYWTQDMITGKLFVLTCLEGNNSFISNPFSLYIRVQGDPLYFVTIPKQVSWWIEDPINDYTNFFQSTGVLPNQCTLVYAADGKAYPSQAYTFTTGKLTFASYEAYWSEKMTDSVKLSCTIETLILTSPVLVLYSRNSTPRQLQVPRAFSSQYPGDDQFLFIPPNNMSFGYQISEYCYKKLRDLAQQSSTGAQVVMIAQCEPDKRINPWTGMELKRSQLGMMVTFLDFLNIFLIMSFAIGLKRAQLKYVKQFDSETLDLTDFSIKVKGLPHQDEYQNVEKFRAVLIAHFESLVIQRRAIKEQRYKSTLDDENTEEQRKEDQYKKNKEGDSLSTNIVADVCFGQRNLDHTVPLLLMQDARQQVFRAKRGLLKTNNGCFKWCLQRKINQGNITFETEIDNYYKAKGLVQKEPEQPVEKTNLSVKLEGDVVSDKEGGEVAEEKEVQKQEINDKSKKMKEQAFTYAKERFGEKEMQYAYVVFRQMSDVDLVLDVYQKYGTSRRCCMCCVSCWKCCYNNPKFQKWRDEYESLQLYGRLLDIKRATDPSMIKWNNLGTSKLRRCACVSLNWIIALLLMAMTLIGVVYLKWQTDQLELSLLPKVNCPVDSGDDIFKQLVIQDRSLFEKSQNPESPVSEKDDPKYLELKNCFCPARLKTDFFKISEIEFDIPINNGNIKKMYLCNDWLYQFLSVKAVVPSSAVIIVILNMAIAYTVIYMTSLEKLQSEEDETRNTFMKLQILQFINTALIILAVNFNFYSYENRNRWFLGFIPIFNGKFTDFSPDWYNRVGAILCLSMFIQIFTPHISKILMAYIQKIRQNMDRGGKAAPLEKPACEIEEDKVDVNTQKLIQDDLNILYTGPEIPVHYVYSQQFTYLWCLLMFSTGMPVMYLIGSGVFCSFYWVYKGLILKVYQKSTKFNHEMPLQNQSYTEIAIFFHIIVGGIMVSQPNIFSEPDDTTIFKQFGQMNKDAKYIEAKILVSSLSSNFFARYSKTAHAGIYFAFVFFFLVWVFVKSTVLEFIEEIFESLITSFKCCKKLPCFKRDKPEELLSNNFYADLDIEHLKNIYEKSLVEKERICELQEFKNNSKGVSECKYTLQQIKEHVTVRVIIIEKTIDDHLKLLHGQDGLDEVNQEEGANYEVKLKYLESYAEQLKALQNVCRMVNITQSFDIYQSLMYKRCRGLEFDIQSKLHHNA